MAVRGDDVQNILCYWQIGRGRRIDTASTKKIKFEEHLTGVWQKEFI